jgi:hypothetical protein
VSSLLDDGSFSNSHRPRSEGTFRVDAPPRQLFTRWIQAKRDEGRWPPIPYPLVLAPGSMSGGNTLADHNEVAMSASGSESVNPVPDKLDNVVPVLARPAATVAL